MGQTVFAYRRFSDHCGCFDRTSQTKQTWGTTAARAQSLSGAAPSAYQQEGPRLSWGCRRSLCLHRPGTELPPGESHTGAVEGWLGSPETIRWADTARKTSGATALPSWGGPERKNCLQISVKSLARARTSYLENRGGSCTARKTGAAAGCRAEWRALPSFICPSEHAPSTPTAAVPPKIVFSVVLWRHLSVASPEVKTHQQSSCSEKRFRKRVSMKSNWRSSADVSVWTSSRCSSTH